jgi:hypothetical protein
MGNEFTSPRRGEDDTVMSGVSGWSHDTREKFKSTFKSRHRRGDSFQPSNLFDTLCGRMVFDDDEEEDEGDYDGKKKTTSRKKGEKSRKKKKSGSDEYSEDDASLHDESDVKKSSSSRERSSDRDYSKKSYSRSQDEETLDSYEEDSKRGRRSRDMEDSVDDVSDRPPPDGNASFDASRDNGMAAGSNTTSPPVPSHGKPLASAFAKRCYFTKAGIGPLTQHYEGLTLAGNTVLMLASAMKLKGCPTICDEDLRRVEQTYPNQFSRLPDELLLSSGWRRISKYCHFSGKPIPDGVPFFHSKERLHHQTGGYYFLLASSLGMERPDDVEPLTIDMLILLQADFPTQCEQAPKKLLENPDEWTLVTRFCFFSGGPINAEEDVYYEADFDGNPIYMLAFLSPNLTPEELYRLNDITGESALKTVAAVEEVDEVYNLSERDFDDLKLYHLGPCRALPSYILSPEAWKKVLPRSFIECREKALARAYEFEAHAQQAVAAAGRLIGKGSLRETYSEMQEDDGYVEFKKGHHDGSHEQQDRYSYNTSHRGVDTEVDAVLVHSNDVHEGEQDGDLNRADLYGPSPHSNDQPEEFPDPEIDMDELSNEFPADHNDPNVSEIPPNEEDHHEEVVSDHFVQDNMPMDEAMLYEKSIKRRSMKYESPYYNRMEGDTVRSRNSVTSSSVSPDKVSLRRKSLPTINSVSPERKTSSNNLYHDNRLKVDTHVSEIIDYSDNSRNNHDIISPMSDSSPSANFVNSNESTPINSDLGKPMNFYSKSSAMRGAHELLKKNRQQRLAIMAKRKGTNGTPQHDTSFGDSEHHPTSSEAENYEAYKPKVIMSRSRGRSVTPIRRKSPTKVMSPEKISTNTPKSPKNKVKMSMYRSNSSSRERFVSERSSRTLDTEITSTEKETLSPTSPTTREDPSSNIPVLSPKRRDENDAKSEATSAVSGTSSVWTDTTDFASKDSRRALILKMAKNRMRTKKETANLSEVTNGNDE